MILVLTPLHWPFLLCAIHHPSCWVSLGGLFMSPTALPFWLLWLHFFSPVSASSQDTTATSLLNRQLFSRVLWRCPVVEANSLSFQGACFFAPRPWIICMVLLKLYSYLSYCALAVYVTDRFSTQNMKAGMLLITFDFRSGMDQAVWSTDNQRMTGFQLRIEITPFSSGNVRMTPKSFFSPWFIILICYCDVQGGFENLQCCFCIQSNIGASVWGMNWDQEPNIVQLIVQFQQIHCQFHLISQHYHFGIRNFFFFFFTQPAMTGWVKKTLQFWLRVFLSQEPNLWKFEDVSQRETITEKKRNRNLTFWAVLATDLKKKNVGLTLTTSLA